MKDRASFLRVCTAKAMGPSWLIRLGCLLLVSFSPASFAGSNIVPAGKKLMMLSSKQMSKIDQEDGGIELALKLQNRGEKYCEAVGLEFDRYVQHEFDEKELEEMQRLRYATATKIDQKSGRGLVFKEVMKPLYEYPAKMTPAQYMGEAISLGSAIFSIVPLTTGFFLWVGTETEEERMMGLYLAGGSAIFGLMTLVNYRFCLYLSNKFRLLKLETHASNEEETCLYAMPFIVKELWCK